MPFRVRRTFTVVFVSCVALAACGDDGDTDRPKTSDIPPEAVAIVGDQPISKQELARRVAAGQSTDTKASGKQQRQQALSLLIQEAALKQEAEDRDVAVSNAEVRRRLASAREQFPNARAFRRFLGGTSKEHLLFQLRLQLLTERIAQDVAKDGGDPKKFQQEFQKRLQERTACRNGSAAPSCPRAGAQN